MSSENEAVYKPCWYGVLSKAEKGGQEYFLKISCPLNDEVVIVSSKEQWIRSNIRIIVKIAAEGEIISL